MKCGQVLSDEVETMNETKIELTHRLQRDGRWEEASTFREKLRRELREAGKARAVANDVAWARMADEFPPLSASRQQSEAVIRSN